MNRNPSPPIRITGLVILVLAGCNGDVSSPSADPTVFPPPQQQEQPAQQQPSPPAPSAPVPLLEVEDLISRDRIPDLVARLAHADPLVRKSAAEALQLVQREPWGEMAFVDGILRATGPLPADAVPALTRCLEDPVAAVRAEAASALGRFGRVSLPAVPALVAALRSAHVEVRIAAAIALGKIGPGVPGVVPALTPILEEAGAPPALRRAAAVAIGRIHQESEAAIPILVRLLRDPNAELRLAAAVSLGKIGPDARAAVPELGAALSDAEPEVRDMAAMALGRIGDSHPSAVAALRARLDDENLMARRRAARALGFIGEGAAAAVPDLARVLRQDSDARPEAGWALWKVGPKALVALEELLRDEDADVRRTAEKAIRAIESPAIPEPKYRRPK